MNLSQITLTIRAMFDRSISIFNIDNPNPLLSTGTIVHFKDEYSLYFLHVLSTILKFKKKACHLYHLGTCIHPHDLKLRFENLQVLPFEAYLIQFVLYFIENGGRFEV